MAIVNSVFVGRAQKSAGNGTFRTVRGRTIISQKVSKRGAITGSLSYNQFALAVISRYASIHAADIDVSFDPTTFGSARNAFFKLNYDQMKKAVKGLWAESLQVDAARLPSDAEIEQAITDYATEHPQAIYRIKKAGHAVVYLTGAWAESSNPVAWVSVSLNNAALISGEMAPLIEDEDTFVFAYNGNLDGKPKFSWIVSDSHDFSTGTTTMDADTFSTIDTETPGQVTCIVTSAPVGKYLKAILIDNKTFKEFSQAGTPD